MFPCFLRFLWFPLRANPQAPPCRRALLPGPALAVPASLRPAPVSHPPPSCPRQHHQVSYPVDFSVFPTTGGFGMERRRGARGRRGGWEARRGAGPRGTAWGGWRDRHAPISHQNAPPGRSTLVPAVSPRDAATSPVAPRLDGSGGMTWTPWGPHACPRPRHALTTSDQVPIRSPSGPHQVPIRSPAQGSRGLIRA